MTWLDLFRCKRSPAHEALMQEADRRIAKESGDLRNKIQTIQSHSRRLTVMAGALALKGEYDDEV